MKIGFIGFLLMTNIFTSLFGQSPVNWTFHFKDIGDKVDIVATANIQKKWAIYSQFTEEDGPIPTTFYMSEEVVVFEEGKNVISEMDPHFEVQVLKFKDKAVFTFQLEKKNKKALSGYVNFMTCDEERCLPPTRVPFNYSW
ncbi:MAG: hypothetical protein WAT79_06765 [Saprospiraceae bacterium]